MQETGVRTSADWVKRLNRNSLPWSKLFETTYVRSSGPGGQKVNKTSSKLVLTMSEEVMNKQLRELLPELVYNKYMELDSVYKRSKQGGLVISSDSFRSRSQNFDECIEKFIRDLQRVEFVGETDSLKIRKWEKLSRVHKEKTKKDKEVRKSKKESRKKLW